MCTSKLKQALGQTQLPTLQEIPDPMWEEIAPILPPQKEPGTPGRPPVPHRKVLNGILYVLRTGCQWNMVPAAFGSGSTCHRRFQEWIEAGLFRTIVEIMIQRYDQIRGIAWTWQAGDAKTLPAPLGGEQTGPNPTDLGKAGTRNDTF